MSINENPPTGEGWRPIETAPKDGTRILLRAAPNEVQHAPEKVKVGFYQAVPAGSFMSPGDWRFEGPEPLSYTIVGWMPLPPAKER